MKILITGKEGQIGKELLRYLSTLDHGWQILALSKHELDITNKPLVESRLTDFSPDIIINTAAYTNVDQAEIQKEIAFAVNRDGVANLAQVAEKLNAVLIHLSSDYVFSGKDLNRNYSEEDIAEPCNAYGRSKLEGEQAIQRICQRYIILRTSWVFGEYGHNFVKTILQLAQEKESLDIIGDQRGGPTFARDIVAALIKIVSSVSKPTVDNVWGIYHFCGQPYTTWAEFARYIIDCAFEQKLILHKPEINTILSADYNCLANRPMNSCLSIYKIKKIFNIDEVNWQQAIDLNLCKFIQRKQRVYKWL